MAEILKYTINADHTINELCPHLDKGLDDIDKIKIGSNTCGACDYNVRKSSTEQEVHCKYKDCVSAYSRPTEKDILELAQHNVLLSRVLKATTEQAGGARGLSWEETMMWAVKLLVEKNDELTQQLIRQAANANPSFSVGMEKEKQ